MKKIKKELADNDLSSDQLEAQRLLFLGLIITTPAIVLIVLSICFWNEPYATKVCLTLSIPFDVFSFSIWPRYIDKKRSLNSTK